MKITALLICFSLLTTTQTSTTANNKYIPYEIYIHNDKNNAPLEKDKCMKGAYISDENNYSNIKSFEEYTGVNNDIYISSIKKDSDLPTREIVDCYAKNKIPMIILKKDVGISKADSIAKACGNMNISMFVQIESNDITAYECIANIFRTYAPKAVLIYSINADKSDFNFPKSNLADWIGINISEKTSSGYIISQYENVAKWCNYLQDKTVMLNISVPNFSTDRCNYLYKEASNEIERLYYLGAEFSNIGAINYLSTIEKDNGIIVRNCRITESPMVTAAYKHGTAVINTNRYWSKSPHIAYVKGDNVIVSNTILDELNKKGNYINSGYSFIKADGFNKSERKIFVKY